MAHIIVIANQKGGVGKTTTAINITTALAAVDKRVLLIDSDPQANASTGLGVANKKEILTIYELLTEGRPVQDVIIPTFIPHLDILPSSVNLIGAELQLVSKPNRHAILQQALAPVLPNYDFIIIDCPPSMGLLTLNAMVAAHYVVVPLQCEYYALEGLSYLLGSIQEIQKNFNKNLSLLGILLTMFDKRSSLSVQVSNDVREHLKSKVFETVIPRNVRVSEAPSFGKPVLVYDVNCLGSKAYMSFAKEILQRVNKITERHSTHG